MTSLLTIGNPKTVKGEKRGYLTAVLHFAPAETAGLANVCPFATAGCKATCLNTAGRGGIFARGATTNAIQEARKRRTVAYFSDPSFRDMLAHDIERHVATAKRGGLTPCVRVNGTSDLPGLARDMAWRFPAVQFYDYTKVPRPWRRTLKNYHLTFSRSETNDADAWEALDHGINVAVVFHVKRGAPLPATWRGLPVIDGDESDLRFLDPSNVYVGLRAKGRARRDASGFVVTI